MTGVLRAVSEIRAEDPAILDDPRAQTRFGNRAREILAGTGEASTAPEPRAPGNTTHVSVIDAAGNAAGITLSHGEGNGRAVGNTGLLMNNFLGEEDLFPGGFHRFNPGDRLPTMMAPTILEEESGAIAVLGAGGSNRIRTAVPQVIANLLHRRDGAEKAVRRGRIHFEGGVLSGEPYAVEGGIQTLERAAGLAREVRWFEEASLFFGGVHLARRDARGVLDGAGDPRRNGETLLVVA
jgi:gamma-glutamyltranspeptidase/glutathione hydrolase